MWSNRITHLQPRFTTNENKSFSKPFSCLATVYLLHLCVYRSERDPLVFLRVLWGLDFRVSSFAWPHWVPSVPLDKSHSNIRSTKKLRSCDSDIRTLVCEEEEEAMAIRCHPLCVCVCARKDSNENKFIVIYLAKYPTTDTFHIHIAQTNS